MKIYINMRDLVTWPKAMADTLASQGHEVIFVDNASTYPPLLEYYQHTPHTVVRLGMNAGPSGPWKAMGPQREPYVVTDPDLSLDGIPTDWPQVLLEGLAVCGIKCGFSIYDHDLPRASVAHHWGDEIDRVHAQVWHQPVHGHYYAFPVDTQFAVYHPSVTAHQIGGMRAAPPYTARHLSWHVVPAHDPSDPALQIPLDAEYRYYLEHAVPSRADWPGSSVRAMAYMQQMMADYDRESIQP